eukprot:5979594-Pyramimonas_sp.AAC.1
MGGTVVAVFAFARLLPGSPAVSGLCSRPVRPGTQQCCASVSQRSGGILEKPIPSREGSV